MTTIILQGDCRSVLDTIESESTQAIITSPPYWKMRRYTDDLNEIGQESTLEEYISTLTGVFNQCRRILKSTGTLWLNIGDAYTSGVRSVDMLATKNLIGIPWRVALALQCDGWMLRSEIIWEKPKCMPESVTDRPTRSHEHVFLFTKSAQYFYDSNAIREQSHTAIDRPDKIKRHKSGDHGKVERIDRGLAGARHRVASAGLFTGDGKTRNARSVWHISTEGLHGEHFAPMPQKLAERCILAGSAPNDTILDPFAGSGTTGRAAMLLDRKAVLIDLAYQDMQKRRTTAAQTQYRQQSILD